MDKTTLICAVGIILAAMFLPGCVSVNCTANVNHTRCQIDVGTKIVINGTMIKKIVKKHNDERMKVEDASDMLKIEWDDDLAETASKWARQCKFDHDKYGSRAEDSLPGVIVGQNLAAGAVLLDAIDLWINEKTDFVYGQRTNKVVGHYTQVVLASSSRVGCGMADCSGQKGYQKYFVCNYAPGFNSYTHPYTQGGSCTSCLPKCKKMKICACKKLCLNRGTLDLEKCECKCSGLYSGTTCEIKTCPDKDPGVCANWFYPNGTSKTPQSACRYSNIPALCPYGCKECPDDEKV